MAETIYDVSIHSTNGISWKGKPDYPYIIRPELINE